MASVWPEAQLVRQARRASTFGACGMTHTTTTERRILKPESIMIAYRCGIYHRMSGSCIIFRLLSVRFGKSILEIELALVRSRERSSGALMPTNSLTVTITSIHTISFFRLEYACVLVYRLLLQTAARVRALHDERNPLDSL